MQKKKINTVEPNELNKNALILDVRSNQEHADLFLNRPHWHIPAEEIIPQKFIKNYHLSETTPLYILSKSDYKAFKIAEKFIENDFENIFVVQGGILKAKEQHLEITEHKTWPLKRKINFVEGALIFIGTLLSLFLATSFYLIPLTIGFLLMLQSITGKCLIENMIKIIFKESL